MNLSERFAKDQREKEKKRKNRFVEDEETMTYMQRTRSAPINEQGTVFQAIGSDSFHVAPSVFDRQAIFHTTDQTKQNQ